jgi:ribose transport system substrate-binding protein
MNTSTFFRFGSQTAVSLLLAILLTQPSFAQSKKLNSVALTVGDLGNPFFVQIAHGAEQKAKEINNAVKFTALSSNYDVESRSDFVRCG